jgi:hypothetical protein
MLSWKTVLAKVDDNLDLPRQARGPPMVYKLVTASAFTAPAAANYRAAI